MRFILRHTLAFDNSHVRNGKLLLTFSFLDITKQVTLAQTEVPDGLLPHLRERTNSRFDDVPSVSDRCRSIPPIGWTGGPPILAGDAQTSGLAITSLILGIFFFIFPAAILGIIFGHIARAQIRDSAGRIKGAGLATAGLVLGYSGVLILPIILIIAAIAIPNLLRAKISANESSAVSALHTLNSAAIQYQTIQNRYPDALENLGPANSGTPSEQRANLIDATLASRTRYGCLFF